MKQNAGREKPRETWKGVVGLEEFYEVSSSGRVRSLRNGGIELRPCGSGQLKYPQVNLSVCGAVRKAYVHCLVLEAFVGPRPEGKEASHLDGDNSNNHISNLAWETHASNMARKVEHGTVYFGSRHPLSKLDREDVFTILDQRARGVLNMTKEASRLGVSRSLIGGIANGKRWKHLYAEYGRRQLNGGREL